MNVVILVEVYLLKISEMKNKDFIFEKNNLIKIDLRHRDILLLQLQNPIKFLSRKPILDVKMPVKPKIGRRRITIVGITLPREVGNSYLV